MQLRESGNKKYVMFLPETSKEAKCLREFPAFKIVSAKKVAEPKTNILYNILKRFPKYIQQNLNVTPFVESVLDQEFKLKDLPESFNFHTKPLKHQEVALRYSYTTGNAGLLLEPGLGKTKIVLDFIYLMKFKKSVIICPKALLFVWEEECQKHRPELSVHTVETTDWKKEKEGFDASDIFVLNYAKAVKFEEELIQAGIDFVCLDEALIKNPKTVRTKSMLRVSKAAGSRGLCSGTLVNNTIEDLYAPIRFIEPSLVGGSFYNFSKTYTSVILKKDQEGKKIPVNKKDKKVDEARSILDSCCIVMTKDEWLKLPPKIFTDRIVNLKGEQLRVYRELASNYISEFQGYTVEVNNPLSLMAKLMQIASGFLYVDENKQDFDDLFGEEDEPKVKQKVKRKTLYFNENPKLNDFDKAVDDELKSRKFILWFNLEAEYQILSKYMTDKGISFVSIKGGEKNTSGKVREFNNDASIQVLLAQAKTVNYGITVLGRDPEKADKIDEALPDVDTRVYTHWFFSMSFSLEVYLQQQDRSHRIGITRSPEYFRSFTTSPVEMRIRDSLDDKQELRRNVLIDIIHSLDPSLIK